MYSVARNRYHPLCSQRLCSEIKGHPLRSTTSTVTQVMALSSRDIVLCQNFKHITFQTALQQEKCSRETSLPTPITRHHHAEEELLRERPTSKRSRGKEKEAEGRTNASLPRVSCARIFKVFIGGARESCREQVWKPGSDLLMSAADKSPFPIDAR